MSGIKFTGTGSAGGAGAENGLSIENGRVVLGDGTGGATAALFSDRFIQTVNFLFSLIAGSGNYIQLSGATPGAGFTDGITIAKNSGPNIGLEFNDIGFPAYYFLFTDNGFFQLGNQVAPSLWMVNEVIQDFTVPTTRFSGEVYYYKAIFDTTINYSPSNASTNQVITNEGAAGTVQITLPTGFPGMQFTFIVVENFALQIVADAADVISVGSIVKAAGGNFQTDIVGSTITFIYKTGQWYAVSYIGAWL